MHCERRRSILRTVSRTTIWIGDSSDLGCSEWGVRTMQERGFRKDLLASGAAETRRVVYVWIRPNPLGTFVVLVPIDSSSNTIENEEPRISPHKVSPNQGDSVQTSSTVSSKVSRIPDSCHGGENAKNG